MANPVTVTFDPTVPDGDESLKTGPSRIQAIPTNILLAFGLAPNVRGQFGAPFGFVGDPLLGFVKFVGDPTDPLGGATAQYADRKAIYTTVDSTDAVLYSGTPAPAVAAYQQNALYIVENAGPPNIGPSILTLSGLPGAPIVRRDGAAAQANDLLQNGVYLFAFDGTNFRLMQFIGGTLTEPLTLAADPTQPLQAASKQYVDSLVGVPVRTQMTGGPVPIAGNTDILTAAVALPDDSSNHLLFVEYCLYVLNGNPNIGSITSAWVTDGAAFWAVSGQRVDVRNVNDQVPGVGILSGAGFSVVSYPGNTTVNLKVQAATNDAPETVVLPAFIGPAGLPGTYMTTTVVRI